MSSTNRELTVEIVKAMIENNPAYMTGNNHHSGMDLKTVINCIKEVYYTLNGLDFNESENK